MRVPAQHVAECLVSDYDTGPNRPSGSLMIELLDDVVDQPRDVAKEPAVVAEEDAQRLRQGEHELAMRQVQKHLVSEMLGKQKRPFLATRRAEVEPDDASLTLSN